MLTNVTKYGRHFVVSRLGDLAEETKTSVYAWVLMSKHMHILLEADKNITGQISINGRGIKAGKIVLAACEESGVSVEALRRGSRRGTLPGLRAQLAEDPVQNLGLTMAETAQQLGVTTSAILRIFERAK